MIRKKKKIKKRSVWRTLFLSSLALLILISFVIFLIFSNWQIAKRREELGERVKNLKRELDLLTKRNQELKRGLSQIQEQEYWEKKLYEQGYKKPGEEVVVVLPPEEKEIEEKKEEKKFWQKILDSFFSKRE
jgi:cell division protein FtsB